MFTWKIYDILYAVDRIYSKIANKIEALSFLFNNVILNIAVTLISVINVYYFFRKPEPPPLTDNQVLDAAVKIIKKRKHEENQSNDKLKIVRNEMDSKRRKKSTVSSSKMVELETQKYLRDIRTRNGKLRRLAAELED